MAKTVSTLKAGDTKEQNFIYTAFGEQMGTQKVSGFGYNAEAYDAATGKINLRARQYEPAMGRFEQKDVFIGYIDIPITKNEYIYCFNNPIMKIDPKGRYPYNIELEYKPNNDLLASPNESIYSNIYDEENTTYVMLFDWSEVKQLTTKEVYAINKEEGEKQGKTGKHISGEGKLYDIESGETINIVWNNIPDMYHTDWSPKNDDDVNIIKKILQPDYDVNDKRWKNARIWSWEAREAILYFQMAR